MIDQDWPSEDSIKDRDLANIIELLDNMARKSKWNDLIAFYAILDPRGLTESQIIAYLRSPFSYRQNIATWISFRDRARNEFVRRGQNSDKLLRGLE
jgi:hypothetical protein